MSSSPEWHLAGYAAIVAFASGLWPIYERRGRDLNPGGACTPNGFRDRIETAALQGVFDPFASAFASLRAARPAQTSAVNARRTATGDEFPEVHHDQPLSFSASSVRHHDEGPATSGVTGRYGAIG